MGRDVRKVPPDWQHPKETTCGLHGLEERYRPMFPGDRYQRDMSEWDEECARWKAGWRPDYCDDPESRVLCYEQWAGQRPHRDDYMPNWPDEQRTHYMMYETTSEGTPISPAFASPEELARWLADTGASAFGTSTASYEAWLRVAKGGYAPTAIYSPQCGLQSGVEGLADAEEQKAESSENIA